MDSSTIYGVDKDYFDTVGYEIVEERALRRETLPNLTRWQW